MHDFTDHEKIERVFLAMYGDEQAKEIGLVQMTREMYQAWSAIIWLGKAATVIIALFAGLGTAWMAFGSWFRHLFGGK